MRVVRDIGFVRSRRRIGRIAAIVGFVLLGSTFLFIFFPSKIVLAYGFLIVGFMTFNYGMQQVGKWSNTSRHPRNDIAIDDRLANLSDKYVVFHYVHVGKLVIEHTLLYPGGIVVLTARDVPGGIQVKGDRWRKKGGGALKLFGMGGPQLGNPSLDTDRAIAALEARLAEEQMEIEVSGAVLLTGLNVTVEVEESDYAVILLSELADFARLLEVDPNFKPSERDRIVELLAHGQELEKTERTITRRPVKVKRRPAGKPG